MKLSTISTALFATALTVFTFSPTNAQDEEGRGPGRGGPDRGGQGRGGPDRGGRGGPGGGDWGRGGPGGGGDPVLRMLQNEDVRIELQVSPAQEEAIGKLAEQSRPERPDGVDFRNTDEEARRAFFEKIRGQQEERMAELKEKLDEVLLPQQMERLEQISLQARGVQALGDPAIAKKLKITDEQRKSLEEVRDTVRGEMRDKMREMFQSGDRSNMQESFAKIREEVEQRVLDVLSSDQQKQFTEMQGEPFEMPASLQGGGRGGPGGAGRGGPGGRSGRGGPGGGADRGGRSGRPERQPDAS